MEPLVTVNILSHNRNNDLRNSLLKVTGQDYKNLEIIVVDNASTDGTAEMVKKEFPAVKLIQLNRNIGISGWNEGFKAANGEYILVLDDDSYPENNTLQRGIRAFQDNPELGIAAFNIFNTRMQKSETEDYLLNPYFFNGCGALIKKELIDTVGFFNELIFIYYHELDYSIRCYNRGFRIMYLQDVHVVHNQSLLSRGMKAEDPFKSGYRFYHYFISYSIILFQYFQMRYSILYFSKWLLNRLIIAVRYNYLTSFCRALFVSLFKIFKALKKRNVIDKSIQLFYRNGNVPIIDREFFPGYISQKRESK